jgi:HK97 family phage major capsid protein
MYVAKHASQMMGQVTEVPMNAVTKYVPTGDTMASMKWQALQSSAKSETNPTFSRATLTAYTGAMWTGVSDELLEDSLVPLAAYFRDIFGEEAGYQFDYQSTSSNADPFTGILHAATNNLTLGAGQASFNDVKFDDLYDAVAKLTTVNKRTNGKWMVHCTVFDILRKVKDANGNYLYQQPSGTQPGTLCGYPYIITDGMTSIASDNESTKFIAFGNPKHFLWGNRLGLEFKVFDQTAYAVEYDEILFRARVRWGFAVGIANAFVSIATSAS